ncbi:hypothetical protein JTB14_001383 [Gonioctena quinquepunctata]|nr:hypothetical protein JTB14_001383 [Gonioctena quinquepunctata]
MKGRTFSGRKAENSATNPKHTDKDLIEAGPSRRGNTDFSSQNSQTEETSGHTDRDRPRGKQTDRSKGKAQAIERKHCSKRRTNTTK